MVTVRSAADGSVLGIAHSHQCALDMAKTNGWHGWYVDDASLPELQLVPETRSTDPRNCRGLKL